MSNKIAVQKFLNKMREQGFKSMSFLVHEEDSDEVRSLVNKLKEKRLSYGILKPSDTIEELNRLELNNKTFGLLHHSNNRASVNAHRSYLQRFKAYQVNSNNYIVAQRIHELDSLVLNNTNLDAAINKVVNKFPFHSNKN